MKFRRRIVTLEAEQWYPGTAIKGVCTEPCCTLSETGYLQKYLELECPDEGINDPHVHTLEGVLKVSPGDWIVTGIKGEKYPVKPHIFSELYEQVE